MFLIQLVSSAYALDCTGLDPDSCAAVNQLQAQVNAEAGATVIGNGGPARLRPDVIYGQIEAVRQRAVASGCTFDPAGDGTIGGVFNAFLGTWDGSFTTDGGPVNDASGNVSPPARSFTGTAEGTPIGASLGVYNDPGQIVADWGDDTEYVAGRWIRTTGSRGVFVTVTGTCGRSVGAAFNAWYTGNLPRWRVFVNEAHFDPGNDAEPWYTPGLQSAGDSQCDGARSASDDEFVEVMNVGTLSVDIGGFTIADGGGVTHTFPGGTVLAPGQTATVFDGGTLGPCNFDPTGLVSLSDNALSLNNTNETVTLTHPNGAVASTLGWTSGGFTADSSLNRFGNPGATPAFTFDVMSVASTPTWANTFDCFDTDGDLFTVCDGDCDDADDSVFPGATESPEDGVDSDCDDFDGVSGAVVFLNELAFDPGTLDNLPWFRGGARGDHQCDGTADTAEDEFIELMNAGPGAKDISGWELHDNAPDLLHVFAPGTVLAEGETITVFAGGALPTPGTCSFTDDPVVLSSDGMQLNNSNEIVRLVNPLGGLMSRFSYGSIPGASVDRSLNRFGDPNAAPTFTSGSSGGVIDLHATPTHPAFP